MEDVKELHGLLLESQEDGIKEFKVLEIVVDHVIEFHPGGPRLFRAKGGKETIMPHDWCNFLDHKNKEKQAPRAQKHVVYLEEQRQLVRLLIFHEGLDTKDDSEVGNECCHDRIIR